MRSQVLWAAAVTASLMLASPALAEMKRDLDREVRQLASGAAIDKALPNVSYRVGVFTYEDPDQTGLGNALAAIVGREILLQRSVSSVGVIRFEKGHLSSSAPHEVSYFDKVEQVATAEDVAVSVWGRVQRNGDRVVIDTFLQLSPRSRRALEWQFPLAGDTKLVAHVRPDRMLIQSLDVPLAALASMKNATQATDVLRRRPSDDAPVAYRLPIDAPYWLDGKQRGTWVYVNAGKVGKGWARAEGYCVADCGPLLDAGRFAADLLASMESRKLPRSSDKLAQDARAVAAQIAALEGLRSGQPPRQATDSVASWLRPAHVQSPMASASGAAFANIRALARVLEASQSATGLQTAQAFDIAYELADASLDDPGNTDVLQNLSELFALAGDKQKAQLARKLLAKSHR